MSDTHLFHALKFARRPAILACALSLAACASTPSGPGVMTLPGTGKSLAQFQSDDATCRTHAQAQFATAHESADAAKARSATLGVLAGTIIGAAIGGNGNSAATGAAIGLGLGAVGAAQADPEWSAQTRYDNAYVQCMYALGHRVPVPASMAAATNGNKMVSRQVTILPPPPAGRPAAPPPAPVARQIPPPPPGTPPAPPPAGSDRR